MPPLERTNIMPIGQTSASCMPSCPAPLTREKDSRPSSLQTASAAFCTNSEHGAGATRCIPAGGEAPQVRPGDVRAREHLHHAGHLQPRHRGHGRRARRRHGRRPRLASLGAPFWGSFLSGCSAVAVNLGVAYSRLMGRVSVPASRSMPGVALTRQGCQEPQRHGDHRRGGEEQPEASPLRQRGRDGGGHPAANEEGGGEERDHRGARLRYYLGGPRRRGLHAHARRRGNDGGQVRRVRPRHPQFAGLRSRERVGLRFAGCGAVNRAQHFSVMVHNLLKEHR